MGTAWLFFSADFTHHLHRCPPSHSRTPPVWLDTWTRPRAGCPSTVPAPLPAAPPPGSWGNITMKDLINSNTYDTIGDWMLMLQQSVSSVHERIWTSRVSLRGKALDQALGPLTSRLLFVVCSSIFCLTRNWKEKTYKTMCHCPRLIMAKGVKSTPNTCI